MCDKYGSIGEEEPCHFEHHTLSYQNWRLKPWKNIYLNTLELDYVTPVLVFRSKKTFNLILWRLNSPKRATKKKKKSLIERFFDNQQTQITLLDTKYFKTLKGKYPTIIVWQAISINAKANKCKYRKLVSVARKLPRNFGWVFSVSNESMWISTAANSPRIFNYWTFNAYLMNTLVFLKSPPPNIQPLQKQTREWWIESRSKTSQS